MIAGWAGFLVNTGISTYASVKMNNLTAAAVGTNEGFNQADIDNNIGIVADKM